MRRRSRGGSEARPREHVEVALNVIRRRRVPLGAVCVATIAAVCLSAAVWGAGENGIVAAALSPMLTEPAIVELRGGGYQVISLPRAELQPSPGRTPAGAGGVQAMRLAVVLINFADAPEQPFSASGVHATVFGARDSVAQLYEEQSFGSVTVTGDVFDWLTVPRGTGACDFGAWSASATSAIGEKTLAGYTNLLIVFPRANACEWSGLAYVNGTTAWINGEPTTRSAAHELGHNLGLGHGSSLTCQGPAGRTSLSADCAKHDEYGDPFTLMGSGGTLHVNGIHKAQLGWLSSANVLDVTASGTYEIIPLGSRSEEPQLLRISRGDSTLVVEYRQAVAAFEQFGGQFGPRPGVTARLATGSSSAPQSLLIDAVPATPSYGDAALAVGRELTDAATGISVTTLTETAKRAVVDVVIPGTVSTAPPRGRPLPPTTLVAVTTPGARRARVDLSWLPAPNASSVSRYLILRNGRTVARSNDAAATRFELHGRSVYRIVAVGPGGSRSAKSSRLVVETTRPRALIAERAPLRGVASRPTADGRMTLGLRHGEPATVQLEALNQRERLAGSSRLSLRLDATRTRLLVRPADRPDARPVQVIAVRHLPLAS